MIAQLEAASTAVLDANVAVPDVAPPISDPLTEYAHLVDIPLRLEALLDRLTMNMRAIATLEVGTVLTLTRSAGDNVDLYVSGVKLASGEIVVIENTLGVRITDLLTGE